MVRYCVGVIHNKISMVVLCSSEAVCRKVCYLSSQLHLWTRAPRSMDLLHVLFNSKMLQEGVWYLSNIMDLSTFSMLYYFMVSNKLLIYLDIFALTGRENIRKIKGLSLGQNLPFGMMLKLYNKLLINKIKKAKVIQECEYKYMEGIFRDILKQSFGN